MGECLYSPRLIVVNIYFLVDTVNAASLICAPMGRKTLPNAKVHVGCRVEPAIKQVLDSIAAAGHWYPAQALELVIRESPRVKAALKKNGKK